MDAFKRFYKKGQLVYWACHKGRKDIPFNMDKNERATIGQVQELTVVDETSKILTVKTKTGDSIVFSKYPEKYFGDKRRGPFSTKNKCIEYMESILPVFDSDGELVNKISKSDNK